MKEVLHVQSKRAVRTLVLLLAFMLAITGSAFAAGGTLQVNEHSKEEIASYIKASGATRNDVVSFRTQPVKNTQRGELSDASKESALKMLNNVRYIAGLDPVSLDPTLGSKAQAAAFGMWSTDEFTHYLDSATTKPAEMSDTDWNDAVEGTRSSNIAWDWSSYASAIRLNKNLISGWIGDSDASNVGRVGHRVWCLNPKMAKTGFGAAGDSGGNFYAMWSFDQSGTGTQKNVAWPAKYTPVDYFASGDAWNLSTGNTSITNISNVSVKLTRRSTSTSGSGSWEFSTSKSYTASDSGEYFTVVENNPYKGYAGMPGAYVIFRPSGVTYKDGDVFDVEISGLGSGIITYSVEFFDRTAIAVAKTEITDSMVSLDKTSFEYTGSAISPAVTVKDGTKTLINGTDYSVDVPADAIDCGSYTVTITGTGDYTGTVTKTFAITQKALTDSMITKIADRTYDASEFTPDITVKDGNKTLIEDADYSVVNAGAGKNAGEYTVEITGTGNYTGTAKTGYNIAAKSIDNEDISCSSIPAQLYTGSAITPEFTLTFKGKALTNADYDAEYTDNVDIGTAIIIVTGKGNFTGTREIEFEISNCAHQWDAGTVIKEATCTDAGKMEYTCALCGETKYETIDALGHDWEEWTTIKEATELADGQQIRQCSVCSKTEIETIPALPPTLKTVKILKPKAGKKSVVVKWKKISKTDLKNIKKVQIQISTTKDFSSVVKNTSSSAKKISKKITGLKKGKTYYLRIRSRNGTHCSKWSSVKQFKAK